VDFILPNAFTFQKGTTEKKDFLIHILLGITNGSWILKKVNQEQYANGNK
jgi:hypothetical protein